MIEKEVIQLKNLTAGIETIKKDAGEKQPSASTAKKDDEDGYVVRIKVFNPEDRTLYAYRKQRRILYDNATRKLTLCLHDQHLVEGHPAAQHLSVPPFIALEGKTETEIKLTMPKVINRILSAAERGGSPTFVEELRVSEATEVEVEIAHQDTPFYYDPKKSTVKQLKEWGRAVSKADFKITPPKQKGDPKQTPETKRGK